MSTTLVFSESLVENIIIYVCKSLSTVYHAICFHMKTTKLNDICVVHTNSHLSLKLIVISAYKQFSMSNMLYNIIHNLLTENVI